MAEKCFLIFIELSKRNHIMKLSLKIVAALILSTQISACVPVVVGGAAAGGAMAADRRTSGIYIEDENIELKAKKLVYEALTEESHVNVTSFKGNVLITGEVPNQAAKTKAGEVILGIENVKSITNELTIGPKTSISSRANDSLITSKVKTNFLTENRFKANHVKVVTENSVVYLMGYVTQKEAEAAAEIASNTGGVTRVLKVFEYMP
jgi:osmotically-inducible protein OsmY